MPNKTLPGRQVDDGHTERSLAVIAFAPPDSLYRPPEISLNLFAGTIFRRSTRIPPGQSIRGMKATVRLPVRSSRARAAAAEPPMAAANSARDLLESWTDGSTLTTKLEGDLGMLTSGELDSMVVPCLTSNRSGQGVWARAVGNRLQKTKRLSQSRHRSNTSRTGRPCLALSGK